MRAYLCGTPSSDCTGSNTPVSAWLGGSRMQRTHSTPQDAFKCYKRHLIKNGYEPIGSRELRAPAETGLGILVLTKPSHFGAELRGGKTGKKGASTGKRLMPKGRRSGVMVRT